MRTLIGVCAVLCICLSVGCIHVEETMELNGDGSGRIFLSYGMSKEHIASLEAAMAESEEGQPSSDGTPFALMKIGRRSLVSMDSICGSHFRKKD